MIEIILTYFAYNLIAGATLCLYHQYMEPGSVRTPELWWLLFFPAIGLGKWKYQWNKRNATEIDFPEKWFIYKYMKKVHWGYVIANVVGILYLVSGFLGLFDSLTDNEHSSSESLIEGILMVFAMAFILSFFLAGLVLFLCAMIALAFLWLLLIYIPHYKMNKIEVETLKRKYLDERDRNRPHGVG